MPVARRTMIAALWKRVKIAIASTLVKMAIHAIVRPNVEWKIIEPFARAQPAILAIHSSIASSSRSHRNPNVPATLNVPPLWPASIKCAKIHAPNAIHAPIMPNAMSFNIIRAVLAHLVGPAIHKFDATNVSEINKSETLIFANYLTSVFCFCSRMQNRFRLSVRQSVLQRKLLQSVHTWSDAMRSRCRMFGSKSSR